MLGINTDLFTNPHSIYREGRSLVINLNTEEIVLCPFRKFFNIDEIEETSMSIVQEQMKTAILQYAVTLKFERNSAVKGRRIFPAVFSCRGK